VCCDCCVNDNGCDNDDTVRLTSNEGKDWRLNVSPRSLAAGVYDLCVSRGLNGRCMSDVWSGRSVWLAGGVVFH